MSSNFLALASTDLLVAILELLAPPDLARAACACRLWRALASERGMQESAFRAPWKVTRVFGSPTSAGFWRHPALDRFAVSHRLLREDTVPGLALKYSVQVMDIKRLNNMMSEHGINSRERLLIPISDPNILSNSTCYIELDPHAQREVAVLYLADGGAHNGEAEADLRSRINTVGEEGYSDSMRSMQVDDATAEYYLSLCHGDPRAAMLRFSEDLSAILLQRVFAPGDSGPIVAVHLSQ